jgi:hypothetical protein
MRKLIRTAGIAKDDLLTSVLVTQECCPIRFLPKEFRVQVTARRNACVRSTVTTADRGQKTASLCFVKHCVMKERGAEEV